jgi:hypothetical protein
MDFDSLKKIETLLDTLKGKKEGFTLDERGRIDAWAENVSDIIASGKSVVVRLLEAVVRLLDSVSKGGDKDKNKDIVRRDAIFRQAFDYFEQAYQRYINKPESADVPKFYPALTRLYQNRKNFNQDELRDLFTKIRNREDILKDSAQKATMDAWLDTM